MLATTCRNLLLAAAGAALSAPAALCQPTPILVVVDSLEADPTATEVQLVVRTAGAAAVADGSLTIEAIEKDGGGALAFAAIVSATAFSTAGDATASATLDVASQRIEVTIHSDSGTINEAFGPLVAIRLALQPGLVEDDRFDLRVVPGWTLLETPTGELLDVLADRGRLRMRAADPGEADLGPEGAEVAAGELAVFGGATGRPFAIGSGAIEILFDASIAAGDPQLVIDPRYGSVQVDSVDLSTPGRVFATFSSPAGDLNAEIYGLLFAVVLPTRSDLEIGSQASVELGPATALFDPAGTPLWVEGGDVDLIEIIPADLLGDAGFEEGDLLEFTAAP